MGGASFFTKAFGGDADEAFRKAIEAAQWRHGHAGYTGTIAEKDGRGYTKIPEDEHKNRDKEKYAGDLMADQDDRVDDKWGPAGAINLSGTQAAKEYREQNGLRGEHGSVWLFFGIASC
jgi:hypothetical protein